MVIVAARLTERLDKVWHRLQLAKERLSQQPLSQNDLDERVILATKSSYTYDILAISFKDGSVVYIPTLPVLP